MKSAPLLALGASALALLGVAAPALAQDDALMTRQAAGDLSQFGGARRLSGDITEAFRDQIRDGQVKHVILFIGDGMGDSEITVARNYAMGAGGFFKGIDALPVTGQYTHYSLTREGVPDYVTDSAASGTAWATGTKSYNGAISVDIKGQPHASLLELAKQAGYATGNVSTAELQDATPAVQMAHVTGRKCYAPSSTLAKCPGNALENGGAGSITEQMLNTRPDVTLGGGYASFAEVASAGDWKGKTLEAQAVERGYTIVRNAADLAAVTAASQDAPLLGLFADGNMPVRWEGPKAEKGGNTAAPVECQVNAARTDAVPTLAAMTTKALELLQGNDKGFFLQVEGASIDKQDHAANPCGQIGETVDLDEAVQVGLEFARTHPDTLVIVTADHAHSSQIIETEAQAPGLTRTLKTREGGLMTVSYGTDETGDSQSHTGAQLRVAAYGPQAANFSGLTDQTDMFFTISNALGLKATQ